MKAPGARLWSLMPSDVQVDSSQLMLKVLPISDRTASWSGMTISGRTLLTKSMDSEILHHGAETGTQRSCGFLIGGSVKASPGLTTLSSIMTPMFSHGIWSATTGA